MQEAQYDFLHGQTDRSDFFSPRNAAALWYYERQSGCFAKRYWRRIFPLYFTVPQYRDVHLRCNVLQGHSIAEQVYKDSFSVVFSLSDALEWKSSGRNQKTLLEKGDCCVYGSGLFDAENIYEAGQRYIGVGLNLHPCRFRSVMDGLQKKKACTAFNGGKTPPKHRITATIEATIRQILQCNYNDCAKSLYQKGKMLELVAAFANEMMDQNSVAVKGSLSWADSEALLRVRRQIDEGFLEPVTIAELSKQHFMCKSKLREIFRKHYGITIYQYMLNRRMEHACELLSAPDAQVKDIAGLVGYSNISHFSDAFRKKFGCTPSEYKRSLPF